MAFPSNCVTGPLTGPVTANQQVVESMLFDLASCVQTDGEAPKPPPIK